MDAEIRGRLKNEYIRHGEKLTTRIGGFSAFFGGLFLVISYAISKKPEPTDNGVVVLLIICGSAAFGLLGCFVAGLLAHRKYLKNQFKALQEFDTFIGYTLKRDQLKNAVLDQLSVFADRVESCSNKVIEIQQEIKSSVLANTNTPEAIRLRAQHQAVCDAFKIHQDAYYEYRDSINSVMPNLGIPDDCRHWHFFVSSYDSRQMRTEKEAVND